VIRSTDLDPDRDTGKTFLGGGHHCPSDPSQLIIVNEVSKAARPYKDGQLAVLQFAEGSTVTHVVKCAVPHHITDHATECKLGLVLVT